MPFRSTGENRTYSGTIDYNNGERYYYIGNADEDTIDGQVKDFAAKTCCEYPAQHGATGYDYRVACVTSSWLDGE